MTAYNKVKNQDDRLDAAASLMEFGTEMIGLPQMRLSWMKMTFRSFAPWRLRKLTIWILTRFIAIPSTSLRMHSFLI